MSSQLLICKFAVFTCVSFFLLMPRVTRMARWLAVCQDPINLIIRPILFESMQLRLRKLKWRWERHLS